MVKGKNRRQIIVDRSERKIQAPLHYMLYSCLFKNYSRIRPSAKMKETMINKSDVEDDTTAAKDNALHLNRHSPKNLFAEKLLVPKIEPATFVSPY